jgi:2-polyprenyl-3-methyl-5-hydroxy-6-metoxy-1,4-benzoquinol methylase
MKNKADEKFVSVNKKQKEFYNSNSKSKKNFASRIWSKIRNGLLNDYRKEFDVKDKVYDEHKRWLGDLSDKKVLDLGCLRGNALTFHMASNAKEYIGIDLSDKAIAELNRKLVKKDFTNAKALAIDFLSKNFEEKNFDVIYAYGVLHHFEDVDLLIMKLNEKLKKGGMVISYDPLETSLPIKALRTLYRPFQSDKEWEWPFTKTTLQKFDKNFMIIEKKGILGSSKYGILLNFLPLPKIYKHKIIDEMTQKDWSLNTWSQIHKCMHLTMCFKKT